MKTMAKTTMTTREFLVAVLDGKDLDNTIIGGMTLRDKGEALVEGIDKRNAAKREKAKADGKPSKAYAENASLRETIGNFLADCEDSVTVKTIAEGIGMEDKPQKVGAVVRQMVEIDKSVERIDKGRNKPLEYKAVC